MIKHSGLRVPEEFSVSNVVIDDSGNYIRTMELGDRSKQTMVMMHGYGGSGIMFYKIMKTLAEHYHIYIVDIIGMGGSSRPQFKVASAAEADNYLIEWFEAWRIKMNIT